VSVGLGAALLCGCKPGDEPARSATTPADPDAVVAIVNGTEIKAGPVEDILARRVAAYELQANRRMSFREQERLRRQLIEQLIEEELVRQAVAASTVTVTDAQVETRMERIAGEFGDAERLEQYLAETGYTLDQFREDARVDMLAAAVMAEAMSFQPTSDEEARLYYEENPQEFSFPEAVAVSHILVPVDVEASAQEQTQIVARLNAIRDEIAAGLPFSNAAATYSECPSAPAGGYLGYVSADDERVSDLFAGVAFTLPASNVSEVVETVHGAHLLYITDRVPAHTATYEEIEQPIREFLDERRRRLMVKEWTQDLRAKAKVEYP
jgi:peptidyl-prolyl cis-trans isomerase C